MSAWKASFKLGVSSLSAGKYEDAITHFTQALGRGGDAATICDRRAAVYQRLGKLKEALRDSKTVIDLEPKRWQGYARSALLFLRICKFDAATRMVALALERVPSEQTTRRDELTALQTEIRTTHEAAVKEAVRLKSERTYHFGKLPVEIASAIFSMLLADDHAYVVTLAQVCRNWRSTILETPSFWRTLVLDHKHPQRKIKAWKKRSRNRISELILLRDFAHLLDVTDELKSLSTEFLQTFTMKEIRLANLKEHIPSVATEVETALHGLEDVTPRLVRGELRTHERSLTFHCRALDICQIPHRMQGTWWPELSNSLVDLESCSLSRAFSGADWPHLLWLLHKNPKLAQFSLSYFFPSALFSFPGRELPATILLPHLEELVVTNSVPDSLLPLLVLPSLKTLHLASFLRPLTDSLDHLAAGTASTLTTLSIQTASFDPQRLIKVLAAAIALESLQLRAVGNKSTNPVLEALARPPPATPAGADGTVVQRLRVYCPALQHLDCSNNSDVSGGPLVRLIRLRLTQASVAEAEEIETRVESPAVRPLKSLIIDSCPAVDPDVLPWIREKVAVVSCLYMSKKDAARKR